MVQQSLAGLKPESSSKQVQELISRLRDGHDKMWERWQVIRRQPEGTGKDKLLKQWGSIADLDPESAVNRIEGLRIQLLELGHTECLYQQGEKLSGWCFVCPVECLDMACEFSYFNRRNKEVQEKLKKQALSDDWEGMPCDSCGKRPLKPEKCPAWEVSLV